MTSEKMIIGLPGLSEVNPKIDWKSGEVSLPPTTAAAVASLKTANESEEEEQVSITIKVEEMFSEEIKKLDSEREKLEEERREIIEKRERLRNLDYDQKSVDDLVWEIENLDRREIRREREKREKREKRERERERGERMGGERTKFRVH
jgi:DNA polymerase sigma